MIGVWIHRRRPRLTHSSTSVLSAAGRPAHYHLEPLAAQTTHTPTRVRRQLLTGILNYVKVKKRAIRTISVMWCVKVQGPKHIICLLFLFFCSHRRQCWYVVLVSRPRVASPPLTHSFSLCLLKSGTQLCPFSVSLFHPPSLLLTVNENLEHNYPCSLSLSLFLSAVHFIHPRLSLSLSPPLMASGAVCEGSSH